ncbi:MAG: FIG00459448: hypothetical protein [uncultured Paraburkholderia sp.]|nr:MAG: FIG00459448: hypothetical protein [uncultured Paraburkholderia sp.]CAH2793931.1 MAG: FIG00459448: hypothetical protein [uncultured Paraburkholderia sp.]CAH2928580.1 MAG: FIG00459448: hypothetical protein [uncultured Paraburkholderia sp.]CAH2929339.1 MAG: FIG00459448: hypothetical protein [uncultured Paraburkholderia sp.]
MRHPALRRSARHSKRDGRPASKDAPPASSAPAPDSQAAPVTPVAPSAAQHHDPSAQNRVAPDAPPDGEFNQGGVRQEGIDYQRDLGSEQDA